MMTLYLFSDLTGCGMDDDDSPPPLPPGHPNADSKHSDTMTKEEESLGSFYRRGGLVRRGSEHSLLNYSLNMGQSPMLSGGGGGGGGKAKGPEGKGKGKKVKKADTFGGRGTPTASLSLMSSPIRSSNNSMFLGGSPSHHGGNSLAPSASFSNADLGGKGQKKQSRWGNIRSKVKKNFSRSPSVTAESDEAKILHKPQRSQSIPAIRKTAVNSRNGSISMASGEDYAVANVTDIGGGGGGIVSPRRRTSNSHAATTANDVNLVSKIFSVLKCWVEEYFEVKNSLFVCWCYCCCCCCCCCYYEVHGHTYYYVLFLCFCRTFRTTLNLQTDLLISWNH